MSRRDCHCGGDGSDGCRIDEAAALTSGRVPGVGVLVAVIQAVLLGCGYIVWQLKVLTDTNPELIVWLLAGVIGAVLVGYRFLRVMAEKPPSQATASAQDETVLLLARTIAGNTLLSSAQARGLSPDSSEQAAMWQALDAELARLNRQAVR